MSKFLLAQCSKKRKISAISKAKINTFLGNKNFFTPQDSSEPLRSKFFSQKHWFLAYKQCGFPKLHFFSFWGHTVSCQDENILILYINTSFVNDKLWANLRWQAKGQNALRQTFPKKRKTFLKASYFRKKSKTSHDST